MIIDKAGGVILLIYVLSGLIWHYLRSQPEEEEEEEEIDLIDSIRLEREVEMLHQQMQKLKQLDEMIIDIRLCHPAAVQKAFRMEWVSTAGNNHQFDFMADGGNPSTEYLLSLAIAEREEVNANIQERICDLYCRACYEDFLEVALPEKYNTV